MAEIGIREPMSREPVKVVVFDLDGTLCPTTTVCLFMARRLGHLEEIRQLEARYARSEISNRVVANADAVAYAGLHVADVEREVSRLPIIKGLVATLEALRKVDAHRLLCSVTWSFATRTLSQIYGFDAYCGTELEEINGRFTGRVARHFDESDKAAFVMEYCRARSIPLARVAAIGDSRSDIPLFGVVGRAIAANATPAARDAAHVIVDTADLSDVLPHIVND